MFDLSNLNDYEFELLCKDILQKKLSTKLYVFSRGVDGGIDICDKNKNPTIIIQAKHYSGSTYSQLKSSLKKEVAKVIKHNPKSYYICTSLSLTKKNKNEIIDIFGDHIPDISYIVDKNDINDFLEEEENQDIVFKHYKLWLCSSNILSLVNNQNIFIDCAELMLDIEAQIKLFVETQAYLDSLNKLDKDNIIIFVGSPGVGKSTISKMVLLFYASKEYIVRYVASNDIGELKKAISLDINKKEIILLDDFLGQHYIDLKDRQPNELKTLISYVEKSINKKLILNSRITILNEAIQTYISFRDLIEKHESKKYLIDLDKMSDFEKAEIFYNHLYFNSVPRDYLSNIKLNKNYFKIIKHKNYNPRIIEYTTKKRNYRSVTAEGYFGYIMQKLDNPEDVWRDEFRNRLNSSDRILMNTLYSLSDTLIENKILEKAFNKRIVNENSIDTSTNPYRDTILRLTDSLLKNIDDRGVSKFSVINPSINDYLLSELVSNESEQINIIDNAVFFEQIHKSLLSDFAKEHFIQKLIEKDLLKLNTIKNSSFFYFIKSVVDYDVFEINLKDKLRLSIEKAHENIYHTSRDEYGALVYTLFLSKFCDYYELKDIFLSHEKMSYILSPLYLDDAENLINAIIKRFDVFEDKDLMEIFRSSLVDKITDRVQEELNDEVSDAASTAIQNVSFGDVSYMEDMVWSILEDSANIIIDKYLSNLNTQLEVKLSDFDVSEMHYYLDIRETLDAMINEPEYDKDDYRGSDRTQSDDSQITEMFER